MAVLPLAELKTINTRLLCNRKLFFFISPSVRWVHSTPAFSMKGNLLLSCKWRWHRLLRKFPKQSTVKLKHFSTSSKFYQTPVAHVPGAVHDIDPFKLAESDLISLYAEIRKHLWTKSPHLEQISSYYFDGHGKAFRPVMVVLMARALNFHMFGSTRLLETQHQMAMIAEMIHTASLVHDDVIDTSDMRRGKSSVNIIWGQKKAILAGDFILSKAARILAQLNNEDVVHLLANVLLDLVQGEFMQMGSMEDETERFQRYLQKTFKKTASLTAYTCQAAATLGGADKTLQEVAFQYGRNIGIAFQLIDDLLDFISSQTVMGKPAAADLRLGLATAPVLFASEKYPELKPMILRRFCNLGDVEKAYEAVLNSDGLTHTKLLAQKHCNDALGHISILADSAEKRALVNIVEKVIERTK